MNTNAAAALAGVSPSTIRRWINAGHVIATKTPAGHWHIVESTLREYRGLPPKTPAPAVEPVVVRAAQPALTEDGIRSVYRLAARGQMHHQWVDLADLREYLPTGAEVDELLRRMERMPDVHLVPEADQKTLTDRRRAAAVQVGGVAKHLILIEA